MPTFLITLTITGKFEIPKNNVQRNALLLSQLMDFLELGSVHLVEAFQTDTVPFENFTNMKEARLTDNCHLSLVSNVSKLEVLSEKSHYYDYVHKKLQHEHCVIDKVWDMEGSVGIGIKDV